MIALGALFSPLHSVWLSGELLSSISAGLLAYMYVAVE